MFKKLLNLLKNDRGGKELELSKEIFKQIINRLERNNEVIQVNSVTYLSYKDNDFIISKKLNPDELISIVEDLAETEMMHSKQLRDFVIEQKLSTTQKPVIVNEFGELLK